MCALRFPVLQQVQAQGEKQKSNQSTEDDDLEELERSSRRRRKEKAPRKAPSSAQSEGEKEGWADWKERSALPEGWDKMNNFQKAGELWSGKRGALFWANKISWAALFVVGGAWILFRFIGPATGLYNLTNDLLTPPGL